MLVWLHHLAALAPALKVRVAHIAQLVPSTKVTAPVRCMQVDSALACLRSLMLVTEHDVFKNLCECFHLLIVPFYFA